MIFKIRMTAPFSVKSIFVDAESIEEVIANKLKIEEDHPGMGRISNIAKGNPIEVKVELEYGMIPYKI